MENLKFSIFDIFAYLLPGAVVLAALVLFATPEIGTIAEYINILQNLNLGLGIVAIILAYVSGNVADTFGSWIYYKFGYKVWGEAWPKNKHPRLSLAQQRALVRQYSPENYVYLQTWKTLKTMSHNLSFAFLLILLVSIFRYIRLLSSDWLVVSCVSLISVIILLKRAHTYDKSHFKEMREIIDVLNLEEKAKIGNLATENVKENNAA